MGGNSHQVLFRDGIAQPRIVRNELLNEFVQTALEQVVHVAVLEPVADAARVALRRTLTAVGDADLIEIAHQIAVAARQRARQRLVEDQKVGDQPRFQRLAIDPMIGRERGDRAQDRGLLIVIERTADMFLLRQQDMILHVEDTRGVVRALHMQAEPGEPVGVVAQHGPVGGAVEAQ